jgi:hypothetical protein
MSKCHQRACRHMGAAVSTTCNIHTAHTPAATMLQCMQHCFNDRKHSIVSVEVPAVVLQRALVTDQSAAGYYCYYHCCSVITVVEMHTVSLLLTSCNHRCVACACS